eukprot:31365-Pelagococcus_subviridis.AAC.10
MSTSALSASAARFSASVKTAWSVALARPPSRERRVAGVVVVGGGVVAPNSFTSDADAVFGGGVSFSRGGVFFSRGGVCVGARVLLVVVVVVVVVVRFPVPVPVSVSVSVSVRHRASHRGARVPRGVAHVLQTRRDLVRAVLAPPSDDIKRVLAHVAVSTRACDGAEDPRVVAVPRVRVARVAQDDEPVVKLRRGERADVRRARGGDAGDGRVGVARLPVLVGLCRQDEDHLEEDGGRVPRDGRVRPRPSRREPRARADGPRERVRFVDAAQEAQCLGADRGAPPPQTLRGVRVVMLLAAAFTFTAGGPRLDELAAVAEPPRRRRRGGHQQAQTRDAKLLLRGRPVRGPSTFFVRRGRVVVPKDGAPARARHRDAVPVRQPRGVPLGHALAVDVHVRDRAVRPDLHDAVSEPGNELGVRWKDADALDDDVGRRRVGANLCESRLDDEKVAASQRGVREEPQQPRRARLPAAAAEFRGGFALRRG